MVHSQRRKYAYLQACFGCETIPFRDKEESSMKKKNIGGGRFGDDNGSFSCGMQHDGVCAGYREGRKWGDSSDGKITMDSSETVKIVPDMAKIVFAVRSEAKAADECQQKNTESLNSPDRIPERTGIDEKSITTSGYYLNPRYDWSSNTRKLIGYEMQTEVTVSDVAVDQVGTLLSTVSETGRMRSIPCLTIPADMMTRMRRH